MKLGELRLAKSDKELLDRIVVREELESRGYKREYCQKYNGLGVVSYDSNVGRGMRECFSCEGKGYFWIPPLMK